MRTGSRSKILREPVTAAGTEKVSLEDGDGERPWASAVPHTQTTAIIARSQIADGLPAIAVTFTNDLA
jgi:hypothetical protein